MTTKNDDDGCLYRFSEIVDAVMTVLFALLYIFSGPDGCDDEPWQIPSNPQSYKGESHDQNPNTHYLQQLQR